jgi:rSAM/selenodomain-associated transferase 2
MEDSATSPSSGGVFQNLRKTKLLVMRGVGLLASIVLLFVIFRKLEPGALLETLRQAKWRWVALSTGIFGVHIIFASYRWHLMLRLSRATIHPTATLRAVSLGHFFNTFLFGAAGGDLVKSMIYARWYQLPLTEVLAMAPLDRFFGLMGALIFGFSMLGIGFLSGGFSAFDGSQLNVLMYWALGLVGVLVVGMWALRQWHGKGTTKFGLFLNHLRKGGALLWNQPKAAFKAAASATIVHLCLSLVMVFNLKAVSLASFSWWNVLWIFPVISMVSGIPVSIGGAGLREGTAMLLLGLYYIPSEDAVTASLLTLGVYFGWAFVGLVVWQREEGRQQRARALPGDMSVSIVIPTLNEGDQIERLTDQLCLHAGDAEWILADGGSTDETLNIALKHSYKVVRSAPGRGIQMHEGAKVASGDLILFLHADTELESESLNAMKRAMNDRHAVAGGFWKRFDRTHWAMTGSRFRCLPRILLGRYVFADQGLFVRRSVLESIGGVPCVRLMEEFELCRKLRRKGRIVLADSTVTTSSRRFLQKGVFRTYWLMGRTMIRYWLGVSPDKLVKEYHGAVAKKE